jgi:hypothetical protein
MKELHAEQNNLIQIVTVYCVALPVAAEERSELVGAENIESRWAK